MHFIIAIDPGRSGGIAMRDFSHNIHLFSMSETEGDIKAILTAAIEENSQNKTMMRVCIEEVGGFVKGNPTPGSAMFNFGRNFGFFLGCCAGL